MLQRARPWLGTIVEVRVAAADGAREAAALESAFDAVARVHAALSFHSPHSELSRLNRDAARGEVAVGADTAAVLTLALELAAASAGAFDPCVGGALVAAGVLPAPAGAPTPDAAADWRDVVLDGDRVHFRRPLWLDLGGIAKGHAVDVALAAALAAGQPLREALTRAQAAAALAVTRLGTQSAMPTAAEVDHLVADLHLQGDTP